MVLAEKKSRAATADGIGIPPPERRDAKAENISVFDAVRAFGVMAGPSALFDLFLVGSVIATISGVLTRPRTSAAGGLRPLVTLGTALAVAYPAVIRPWMQRWGPPTRRGASHCPAMNSSPTPLPRPRGPSR